MKLPSLLATPQTPLFWVALMRVMLGLVFLTTWASNLSKGFMPIGILGVCFLVRAGRSVGVDTHLHRRFGQPKLPLW